MLRSFILFVSFFTFTSLFAGGISSNYMPQEQGDTVYYIPGVMNVTARLYSDKDNASSVVMYVPADSAVMILDTAGTFFLVHYHNTDGYVRQQKVKDYKEILYELTAPSGATVQQPKNRHDLLIAKYGQNEGRKIYEHMIWKGMSSEMVMDSWGNPQVINHYDTGTGFREEWIYPKYILKFSNGTLTGWISR